MNFRFLHCADLHLDSPLRGLEADPDAPADVIRSATRRALENLVDFAIREDIAFVVAAGDLYDGDWQDWRTGQFLIRQIARLTAAGIAFIAIRGNHDAESIITRRLRMPDGMARWLDSARPETIQLPNLPVSIHGQSFVNRAVPEDLSRNYPLPDPDRFNIGLLHTSIDGNSAHSTYAPCSVEWLRAHGYDYWALGHIHARAELSTDPWIVFSGNLQGRHANEPGAKGATLVTVVNRKIVAVDAVALDVVRWTRIHVDLTGTGDEEAVLRLARAGLSEAAEQAGGRLVAARIVLSGATATHAAFHRDIGAIREKLRAEAMVVGGIWVESVEIRTRPLPAAGAPETRPDAIGKIARALVDIDPDAMLEQAQDYRGAMLEKAGPLRQVLGGDPPDDLIRRATELLLGALAED